MGPPDLFFDIYGLAELLFRQSISTYLYARLIPCLFNGKDLIRLPVAAKIALVIAVPLYGTLAHQYRLGHS
ncbi:MAG: hypothetical protein CM1200mP4_4680 [Rhodospirillaceae bacterium]|nr:MAG: hypothetical protein CM1200mP4_4680 [Rhodospirillaceae bacterium]